MTESLRRPMAALLVLACLLAGAAMPVAASDPTPTPAPATPTESAPPGDAGADGAPSVPTIHAEMLTEHAADAVTFAAGDVPPALDPAVVGGALGGASVQADSAGEVQALPNGLRKEVLGYLPYWAVTGPYLSRINYDLVSTIAYFSVGANSNGTLAKTSGGVATTGWAGWTSSGMTSVITRAHQHGSKVVLTVTMMAWNYNYTAMTTLLANAANRNRLATEIASAVKARNADGVNLDFEPMPNSLENHYTAFVRKVKSELVRLGAGRQLTVAATGGAASWNEGYELVDSNGDGHHLTSSGSADAIMVMAYDFNYPGSARAGGVAPIDSPYVIDVRSAMAAWVAKVPASKLIWGVPYYGRAWTTNTSAQNGRTCFNAGTCTAASWAPRYIDAIASASTHGRRWDSAGRVPWYTHWSSSYGTHVQGYYDDATSLGAKYSMVKASGLRGIGIWHLLMDGDRPELWNALAGHFLNAPFSDVGSSEFLADIAWLADTGITNGCGDGQFCPRQPVLRDQMASFLARALDLPAATVDFFGDDAGNFHQADINRVATAGITIGCADGMYCPGQPVLRDQMASFLARALDLPAATEDFFSDDDGSDHEADINRVAAAGITLGCGDGRFCPARVVTREQMAAFLHRALGS